MVETWQPLDLDALRLEAEAGRIDTVFLAMVGMRGRLQGKRLTATHFFEEVVEHYLNAARVEIEAFEAAVTDWERYRNFERT